MAALPEHPIDHPSEHLVQNLATAVEGTLWRYDPIRQTNSILAVSALDGVVTLSGHVRSEVMRSVAGHLARTVPGVREVLNRIVTDTALEGHVAVALATDPEVGLLTDQVAVKSLLGEVYLGGVSLAPELATAEAARAKAEAVARTVPGVREVVNEIRAVEGSAAHALAAEDDEGAAVPAGGGAADQARQERLRVWRERAAARGG
jgi:osmotically-inducible protein OsmY